MPEKKTTIHDIAKSLKINSSTVSRALNNSELVSPNTRKMVWDEAKKMNYQKNELASNFRRNKTKSIAVIVPRISRNFFSEAIAGIEEVGAQNNYRITIFQSQESVEKEKEIVKSIIANRADGVIISISMDTMDDKHLIELKKNNIPLVYFDRCLPSKNIHSVVVDDFRAAYNATKHLIDLGFKKIAHLSGPTHLNIYKNRKAGYLKALEDHNIKYEYPHVFGSDLIVDSGYKIAQELIREKKFNAFFCANDWSALGILQYLKNSKTTDNYGIVGYSNEPMTKWIEPSLTSVNQPGFEMGKKASTLLIAEIESKNNQQKEVENYIHIIKSPLIKRESSNFSLTVQK